MTAKICHNKKIERPNGLLITAVKYDFHKHGSFIWVKVVIFAEGIYLKRKSLDSTARFLIFFWGLSIYVSVL